MYCTLIPKVGLTLPLSGIWYDVHAFYVPRLQWDKIYCSRKQIFFHMVAGTLIC